MLIHFNINNEKLVIMKLIEFPLEILWHISERCSVKGNVYWSLTCKYFNDIIPKSGVIGTAKRLLNQKNYNPAKAYMASGFCSFPVNMQLCEFFKWHEKGWLKTNNYDNPKQSIYYLDHPEEEEDMRCIICHSENTITYSRQIRSPDEAAEILTKCMDCNSVTRK